MSQIFGVNPVMEQLMADPGKLELINLPRGPLSGQLGRIARMAREHGIRIVFVDKKSMTRMADGGTHQGVIARVSEYKYSRLDEILSEEKSGQRIVVLDGVQDPHNLGAIVRTAVCAGVTGIIIPELNAVGMTATAIKTSAGAASLAKVVRVKNMARTLKVLQDSGYWNVALEADGKEDVRTLDPTTNYALIFGSEGKGVRKLVRERCDITAYIPMKGEFNSLNVSVSVGVVLFSLLK